MIEKAREMIQALGRKMSVDDIDFGSDRTVVLSIDSAMSLAIGFEQEFNTLTLFSPINGSNSCTGNQLKTMLISNFMWQATQGATLAVDPATDYVVMHLRLPLAQLTQEKFDQHVETFVNVLQKFTRLLAEGTLDGASRTVASSSNTDFMRRGAIRA